MTRKICAQCHRFAMRLRGAQWLCQGCYRKAWAAAAQHQDPDPFCDCGHRCSEHRAPVYVCSVLGCCCAVFYNAANRRVAQP